MKLTKALPFLKDIANLYGIRLYTAAGLKEAVRILTNQIN